MSASVAGLMPDGAGTLEYATGSVEKPDHVTVSGFSVDGGGNVSAKL